MSACSSKSGHINTPTCARKAVTGRKLLIFCKHQKSERPEDRREFYCKLMQNKYFSVTGDLTAARYKVTQWDEASCEPDRDVMKHVSQGW